MTEAYPYELDLDQILIKRRHAVANPNIGAVHSIVLREGPRASKIAVLYEIIDPKEGRSHHHTLKLESLKRTKKRGWEVQTERSFALETGEPDEIRRLTDFLFATLGGDVPSEDGSFVVMREGRYEKIGDIASLIDTVGSSEKAAFLRRILAELAAESVDVDELRRALEVGTTAVLRRIAVASRLVEYRRAVEELQKQVESAVPEHELQALLERHPWMFGSEYSELLRRRIWTRDDEQDFMLRRTVDGYLEIIEIKRPIRERLLRHDEARDSHYPSHHLSKALGQAFRYIAEVERNRDSIVATDHEEPLKIRARIIIGRDGDEPEQRALRVFNSHLHRVEVLTFDQLLRIAHRVVDVFEEEVEATGSARTDPFSDFAPAGGEEDLPF